VSAGLQDYNLTFPLLYEQARHSVPVVTLTGTAMLAGLRSEYPGLFDDVEFETGTLKARDRAFAKINSDYAGDHSQICDLARGRFIVDTAEQIEAIREFIKNSQHIGILTVKDRFANPSDTHFRDINMKVRLINGHVAELRVEQRDVLAASKYTHEPYRRVQEIDRMTEAEGRMMTEAEALERQQLMDKVRDIHDIPARKAGLDRLLDQAGRINLAIHESQRVENGGLSTVMSEAAAGENRRPIIIADAEEPEADSMPMHGIIRTPSVS